MNTTDALRLYDEAQEMLTHLGWSIKFTQQQQRYWTAKLNNAIAELPAVVEAERVAGKVWDK